MDSFHVLPIGSIYAREEKTSIGYLDIVQNLPIVVKSMVSSVKTASYIKGIARTYDIPEEKQSLISFAILEIAIGKKTLAQLPAILSTELRLSNDKAQKMATEIEKDVFGPVKAELDEFIRVQRVKGSSIAGKLGTTTPTPSNSPSGRGGGTYAPQNVLNLKELPARKPSPQLTPKPVQKDFPVRPAQKPTLPAPHPNPLPERERGTTPKPRFPLPPKPIRFT